MEMRDNFVKWQGKENVPGMVDFFLQNPDKIPELIECCMDPSDSVDMRATWILNYLAGKDQSLVQPYLQDLVSYMAGDVHTGVKRHVMRLFEDIDIPEELEGILYDHCIEFILNPKLPVAVPAFAMTVGTKICIKYPELIEEFLEVCRTLSVSESPAIKVRLKRVIKALEN